MVVRDGLTIGPWQESDGNGDDEVRTRPPTDQDADHMLVRMIECVQGSVQVEVICEPMFDYGTRTGRVERCRATNWGAAEATCSTGDKIALHSDLRLGIEGSRARARHTLVEGERRYVALGWSQGIERARVTSRTSRSGCSTPSITGGIGWPAGASRTTAGAVTCTVRRSR